MLNIIRQKESPIFSTDGYDAILLGTTIFGDLEIGGFQAQMRFKYPYLHEAAYRQPYGDQRLLGTRLTLRMEGDPAISLLYICGYPDPKSGRGLDKKALEHCLATANAEFRGMKVLTTVLGASPVDGNGYKRTCLAIMERTLTDLDADVFDFPQADYETMCRNALKGTDTKSEILAYNTLKGKYLKA